MYLFPYPAFAADTGAASGDSPPMDAPALDTPSFLTATDSAIDMLDAVAPMDMVDLNEEPEDTSEFDPDAVDGGVEDDESEVEEDDESEAESDEESSDEEETDDEESSDEEETDEEAPTREEVLAEIESDFVESVVNVLPEAVRNDVNRPVRTMDDVRQLIHDETQANESMVKLYAANPDLRSLTTKVMKGDDLVTSIVSQFSDVVEIKVPEYDAQNPEPYNQAIERVNEVKRQVRERAKEEEQARKDYEAASTRAKAYRERWQKQKGYSNEQMDSLVKKISTYLYGDKNGELPEDFYDVMEKALDVDSALASAEARGAVKGANEVIKGKRAKKQAKRKKGVPTPRSGRKPAAVNTAGDDPASFAAEFASFADPLNL